MLTPIKKILFLCSCIEKGHDGIGDYTLRLASECIKEGIKISILALFDGYIEKPEYNNVLFPSLRIPKIFNDKKRIILAKTFKLDFSPDIISIQFMPYSFNKKGIVFFSSFIFRKIIGITPVQIMFHELWIGAEKNAVIKDKFVGKLQKFSILFFIKILKPIVIHTSLKVNVRIFEQQRIKCILLPLFSNIPFHKLKEETWIYDELQKGIKNFIPVEREKYYIFTVFGTLYSNWNLENFLNQLTLFVGKKKQHIIIVSIGAIGLGKKMWDTFNAKFPNLNFMELGRKSTEEVSDFLQFSDFGIATTPYILLGKSGSFLAMKEHGLPVFCDINKFKFNFGMEEEEIQSEGVYQVTEKYMAFDKIKKLQHYSQIENTCRQFIGDCNKNI